MRSNFGRLGAVLAIAAALVAGPLEAGAQTNMTGTWDLAVVTDSGQGTVTLVLTQTGDSISGQYTGSTFGQATAGGKVTGNEVSVRVSITDTTGQFGGGQIGTITLAGTLSSPTAIAGSYSLDSALVPLTGTFSGTKRAPGAPAPTPAAPATPPAG